MHMNTVNILDQDGSCNRKIVEFWIVLKVESTGLSGGLDVGHKGIMEPKVWSFGLSNQKDRGAIYWGKKKVKEERERYILLDPQVNTFE